jgi:alcohol dehydrogenase class IV
VLDDISKAKRILKEWKGDSYVYGQGVLDKVGGLTRTFGKSTLLVACKDEWAVNALETIRGSLDKAGVSCSLVLDVRPNAPREDLYRTALQLAVHKPESVLAFGGGSTIDACKGASVLASYTSIEVCKILGVDWYEACTIDPYFGTGIVTRMREATGRDIVPVVAVQTAASSGAHLTKYSNITDPITGQKKLIVDEAIVPKAAVFDHEITVGAPKDLTLDGGLDGISHLWEVFMGATGKANYEEVKRVVSTGIRLIVGHLKTAWQEPQNIEARSALGLGTDLGGYAIMIGGTNGPHLGSFSLVDVMTHGRACAVLLPYYTVLFAPAIQDQLRVTGSIFKEGGYVEEDIEGLEGRRLGEAVAKGMINFIGSLEFPTTLKDAGTSRGHLDRMIEAAKNPQLRMKLSNMPIPLNPDAGDIERYMKPVLEAAFTGELELIKTLKT